MFLDVVENYEVTLRFGIREFAKVGGTTVYDWFCDNGLDSDQGFESVEDAIADIKARFK